MSNHGYEINMAISATVPLGTSGVFVMQIALPPSWLASRVLASRLAGLQDLLLGPPRPALILYGAQA